MKRIKDALTVLFARNPWSAVRRITVEDPLSEYYDELATPERTA